MLVGKYPFGEEKKVHVTRIIVRGVVRWRELTEAGVSEEGVSLVKCILTKKVSERPTLE